MYNEAIVKIQIISKPKHMIITNLKAQNIERLSSWEIAALIRKKGLLGIYQDCDFCVNDIIFLPRRFHRLVEFQHPAKVLSNTGDECCERIGHVYGQFLFNQEDDEHQIDGITQEEYKYLNERFGKIRNIKFIKIYLDEKEEKDEDTSDSNLPS